MPDGVDLFVQGGVYNRFLVFCHAEDSLPRDILREQKIKNNPCRRDQKKNHDPCQSCGGVFPFKKYDRHGDDEVDREKPRD